jgi:anthranilate phosphoribosyltransferase
VCSGKDLTEDRTRDVFVQIMSGTVSHEDIVSFLKALRDKGETAQEITGAAKAMREKSLRINAGKGLVDTCGTGGTGINTFNISTAAAFVTAGCGVRVAKHGNRSASGHCGSADVLEALGIKIELAPEAVRKAILKVGIGFMYAPLFHSAMKYASKPRKEIGGRTIFNILGPLSNPAGASAQVIGVYDGKLVPLLAGVLKNLGAKRAMVVHGSDGLDEISVCGQTSIAELRSGRIKRYKISPEDLGMGSAKLKEIRGGSAEENAAMLKAVLKGQTGAKRDIVILNAAASLVVASKAKDLKEGIARAARSIDSGAALKKLKMLKEFTNRL